MFGASKFSRLMPHPGFNKKNSKAPDYKPMAEASAEAARIMGKLGADQLDFAKSQYADLAPFFKEISQQQVDIANKTSAQGDDYYGYQKSFRPVEQKMLDEAMQGNAEETAAYNAANKADAAALTQDDAAIYNQNKATIDAESAQAVADSQGGYTRSLNQAMRQGLRYGAAPAAIAGQVGQVGMAQAQQTAAAANGARAQGVNSVRQRLATGLQLRQSNMNSKNSQDAIGWARKLDAAGLVKGMAGASQGAYGLAISAGNSAGANSQAAGSQYMSGMGQGASTTGQGLQMNLNGQGQILNSQTQMALKPSEGGIGEVLGAGAKVAGMFMSDPRLKENVELVGVTVYDLPLYEYNYIGDDTRYRGVMADEVERVMPEAVAYDDLGFMSVNYDMLGIEMEKA